MATRYWRGGAVAVAQVATATFATYDVATTRIITIGGYAVSAADSGGTLTAALSAFATVLNNSTHPYFTAITWSSNATQIIGTADQAGVPFTFAGSVSGGTGTCSNAYTVSTANAGPNVWGSAQNWSAATVPVSDDVVIFKDSSIPLLWDLDQAAIALDGLYIHQSYTGKIGLPQNAFTQSADGGTTVSTHWEYRTTHLTLDVTAADGPVEIGQNLSASAANGSQRIKLSIAAAANIRVYNTASSSAETGLPAVRLKLGSASSNVYVIKAPGGVGIAAEIPGDTSTVGAVQVSDTSTSSRVYVGSGTTITSFEQNGGDNVLQAAATVTLVEVNGGNLQLNGAWTATTLEVNGGKVNALDKVAVTTANLYGGTTDTQQSNEARTWSTVNFYPGATLKGDSAKLTITTLNEVGGKYTLTSV